MMTLVAVAVFEFLLVILPGQVPANAVAVVVTCLLLSVLATAWHDTAGPYTRAVGYAIAISFYCASIPRYLVALNPVYVQTDPMVGVVLTAMVLLLTPLALLLSPIIHGAPTGIDMVRSRFGRDG